MSRLPIRMRLTLPFAFAMALVLAALGAFVYLRVGSTLLATEDATLRAQEREAVSHFEEDRPLLDRDTTGGASIAQVLGPGGNVVQSLPAGLPPLVGQTTTKLVLSGRTVRLTKDVHGLKGSWRLLAAPAGSSGAVLVLGRSLNTRSESLVRLRHEFLFAAPAALLLATLAGYVLAGAALRPVEAMRRRAAAISAATPGARLPIPAARDEVSRLAETLNGMLDRLEAAFQHERQFVADASHELRTPLALLRTELELALRRPRSHEELEHSVRSAADETERLTRLAEDLLLIARSDQHALPVRRRVVSAQTLLEDAAARFAARANDLGRELVVEGGDQAALDADPERVAQALDNLVDNALTHGGGTVRLSIRKLPREVELHVADEGAGFPPGFAARAFDRFSRADEARGRGGTGLGLAIVRAIANAHGGSVGVSDQGRGADVWIRLAREEAGVSSSASLGQVPTARWA